MDLKVHIDLKLKAMIETDNVSDDKERNSKSAGDICICEVE